MTDNVIYTITSHDCSDAPNAVWAIDLSVDPIKVRSLAVESGSGWNVGGPILGIDSVHVPRISRGPANAANQWTIGIQSLTTRELKPTQQSSPTGSFVAEVSSSDLIHVASPAAFVYKERELVVSVCSTGRLCLNEPSAVASFNPPMTPPLIQPAGGAASMIERGIWGSLSSWQEMDGTRWILAPVTGPLHPELKAPLSNGATPNGSIVAFKVEEQGGRPTLTPAWVSRDLDSPLPPVVANGVVFALSAGEFTRQLKTTDGVTTAEERPKSGTRATLYAFDARTGKELWSSKNLVTGPASLTGITVANGRVYFGGLDGTLYAFGMYMER
jgi:hypothetical protein